MPKANLRVTFPNLDVTNAGQPAGLSGVATITGTMRDGQTPVASWPSVVNGKPVTSTATYIIRYSTNGGTDFVIAKQGGTPQTMDALTSADVGRQYQLVMRVHNAANQVDAEPQILSALSAVVTAAAISAPTFASGPILTGTAANDQVMTVAFTTSGTAPITSSIRWFINDGEIVGETGTTWTGLGLVDGDLVKAQVMLSGPGGDTAWVDSNTLLATPGTASQTATFGTVTPAGSGGWRPQLASGAVESLATYNSLTSGSLGAYTPSISAGRLVFSGAAGAPNGAVLNCTGTSGRVYTVTIATVANRKDIATNADITAAPGITANLGLTLVIRQNAQIPPQTGWLSGGGSQALIDSGLLSPITMVGEGYDVVSDNYHVEEHHVSTLDAYFPSGFTAHGLVFKNDPSAGCFIFRSNSGRKARAQGVYGCRMQIDFNVDNQYPDGPQSNWNVVTNTTTGKVITRGFGSTGYNKSRGVYVTGGYCRDFTFNNNRFIGLYVQAEVSVSRTVTHMGNIHSNPYFDYIKLSLAIDSNGGAAYEGANLITGVKAYSIYEDATTAPHKDGDQAGGNLNAALTFFSDARVFWHTTEDSVQARFYADRSSTAIGGHRVSFKAETQMGRTPHALTVTWPDNAYVDGCILAPGPQYLSRMPISSAGSSSQVPLLGAGKNGDGGAVGTHRFNRMYSRTAPATSGGSVGPGPIGPDPSSIVVTNSVAYNGYTEADLALDFYHWADWGSLPELPSYADAFEYICRAVPGSDLDAITYWGEVTLPADGAGSDYTISDNLRPVPALSALTVTNTATAAFTVTHDLDDHVSMFWSVFSAQTTDPDEIKKGRRWTGSAWASSLNYGYVQAGRGTLNIVGGGTAALASGTYWLCVAQYNGPKKTGVATVQFTVT